MAMTELERTVLHTACDKLGCYTAVVLLMTASHEMETSND
jgi:hypothetical protein